MRSTHQHPDAEASRKGAGSADFSFLYLPTRTFWAMTLLSVSVSGSLRYARQQNSNGGRCYYGSSMDDNMVVEEYVV